jgi:hypothetical protein
MRKTFRIGDRAKTVVPITLPHATVAAGIEGRIADVDPDYPTDVLFVPDDPTPDLAEWNNFVPADAAQLNAIYNPWRIAGCVWIAAGVLSALFSQGPYEESRARTTTAHVSYPAGLELP